MKHVGDKHETVINPNFSELFIFIHMDHKALKCQI